MAAPRPLVSRRTKSDHAVRHFTVAQANATLPLVKRIVADLVKTHSLAIEQEEMLNAINAATPPVETKSRLAAEAALQNSVTAIKRYADELDDVGCAVKDYRTGLIDFIGTHQGRDICLCWKPGEPLVGYWHEITAGYSGRKPISTLVEI